MIRKKLLAGIMTAAMALTMCMGTRSNSICGRQWE